MKRFLLAFGLFSALTSGWCACPHEDTTLLKWSNANTWDDNKLPKEGSGVLIDQPILLDVKTPRLGRVNIKDGGKLVFSPDHDVSITANYIQIGNNGSLDIGGPSSDCRYTRDTEILLTGKFYDNVAIPNFGNKFLGVKSGGSLEIHGAEKLSWTQLTQTLTPKSLIYNSDESGQPSNFKGFTVYIFNPAGVRQNLHIDIIKASEMETALSDVVSDSVVIIAKAGNFANSPFSKIGEIQTVIENKFGLTAGSLLVGDLTSNTEAWTILLDNTNATQYQEAMDTLTQDDQDGTKTEMVEITVGGNIFKTWTSSRYATGKGVNEIFIHVHKIDYLNHELNLLEDASSWNVGDKVVITSTDYDWEQAETMTVSSVDGKKVVVDGDLEYEHYGETYEGLDMRAQVGLLTRNIKIHGEMETECGEENSATNVCKSFGFDGFGGHTKALKGFKAYNIEGAEIYHMGQIDVLGAYPVHFHMCLDTDLDGTNPKINANSIHHTFSRCVTIHGSHGVHVTDNVAYDHYGHCFFQEDGGERRTKFDHNLGLGTRLGHLTPSDEEATTFWITSPLTELTNNVAAGSHISVGTGFWLLFPIEPVGPSKGVSGMFKKDEGDHTLFTRMYNNIGHSNGNAAFALNKRLGVNHEIVLRVTYNPLVDPLDLDSKYAVFVVDTFHAYKNKNRNIIVRCTGVDLTNFYVGDSLKGFLLYRNLLGGFQRVRNSTVIGDTPNKGQGETVRRYNLTTGEVIGLEYSNRSFPSRFRTDITIIGIQFNSESASHISDVRFINFKHNKYRNATALFWNDNYLFINSPATAARGLSFDYSDPDEGWYMRDDNLIKGAGEYSNMIRDIDGTLTGKNGSTVTRMDQAYTNGITSCQARAEWNMQVCEQYFTRVHIKQPTGLDDYATFMSNEAGNVDAIEDKSDFITSYALAPQNVNVLNWNSTLETNSNYIMAGLESGMNAIFGVCLPMGMNDTTVDLDKIFYMEVSVDEADSMNQLKTTASKNLFYDRSKSIVYRKFSETRTRDLDKDEDLSDCIGDLRFDVGCPYFSIKLGRILNQIPNLDMDDANCSGR